MLKIIGMNLLANLVHIDKNSTINKVGNSKIIKIKMNAKTAKAKSKNLLELYLSTQNFKAGF